MSEEEKYGLNWVGKNDAIKNYERMDKFLIIQDNIHNDKIENKNSENLLITGDNLQVLRYLSNTYSNKIKMIYIDPPYNTGNKNFLYNDTFRVKKDNHSSWLTFMYPRLKLAKDLLRDDGVIFISIDDHEVANLKLICNEIFGEENFIAQLVWKKTDTPSNLSSKVKVNTEYILVYEKNKDSIQYTGLVQYSPSTDPMFKPNNSRKTLLFPAKSIIYSGKNGEYISEKIYGTEKNIIKIPKNISFKESTNISDIQIEGNFVWTQEKLNYELSRNTKIFCSKNTLILSYKKEQYSLESPPSLITSDYNILTTEWAGENEIPKLFENKRIFSYPKPVSLIKYLLQFKINSNDLILDFFAGSGTTAHAVMELNKEKNSNLKYIMVQLDEPTRPDSEAYKAGFTTIDQITKERIIRAAQKLEDTSGFQCYKVEKI